MGPVASKKHARLRQAVELAPDFGWPHATLALIEWQSGHPSDAVNEARTALTLDANDASVMGDAGYGLAVTGHAEEARKLLARVQPWSTAVQPVRVMRHRLSSVLASASRPWTHCKRWQS
jgi:Flp pilus assembly protein TadD